MLELREHLNAIYENKGRFVLISGKSGVGKTRLVDEFLNSLDHASISVLQTRIFGMERRSFEPLRSLFDSYFHRLNIMPALLTRLVPLDIAPSLCTLVPGLAKRYPVEIPESSPMDIDIASGVDMLLEHLTRLKPSVMVFDDLHLVTDRTKKLIKAIVRRINNKALLVIGCCTVDMPQISATEWKERKSACYTIGLQPFSQADTDVLLYNIFEQVFPLAFNAWVYKITQGNSYFVKEFVTELVGQNILSYNTHEQQWKLEKNYRSISVPENIRTIFESRLHEIDDQGRRFLQVAALVGEHFDPNIVFSVARIKSRTAEQIITRLLHAFLVSVLNTNYLQFIHPELCRFAYNAGKRLAAQGDLSQANHYYSVLKSQSGLLQNSN